MAESVYSGAVARRMHSLPPGKNVPAEAQKELVDKGRVILAELEAEIDSSDRTFASRTKVLSGGVVLHVSLSKAPGVGPSAIVEAAVPVPDSESEEPEKETRRTEPDQWTPPLFLAFGKWAIDYTGGSNPWSVRSKPPEIRADDAWNGSCVAPARGEHEEKSDWIKRVSPRNVAMCLRLGDQFLLGGYGAQSIGAFDGDPGSVVPVVDINGDYHEYPIRDEDERAQNKQENTQEWELTYGMLGERYGLNGLTFGVSMDGTEGSPNHTIARIEDPEYTLPDKLYWNRVPYPAALWVYSDKRDNHESGGLWCNLDLWFDMDLGLLIENPDGTRRELHHSEFRHFFRATSKNIPTSLTFINTANGSTTYINDPEISIWNTEAAFYGELYGLAMANTHTLGPMALVPFIPYCWFDLTYPAFVQRRKWKRVVIFDDVEIPVELPTGLLDEVNGYLLSSVAADDACIVAIEVTHVDPDSGEVERHADDIAERLIKAQDRPDMLVENQESHRLMLKSADKTVEVTYWAVAAGEATDITDAFEKILEDVELEYDDLIEQLDDKRPIVALRATAAKAEPITLPDRELP